MAELRQFEMRFDPRTIEHLGVKMYSTLPPALAELISNAYDADASNVELLFHEENSSPQSIQIVDNGEGMSSDEIQQKFLVIGRNRRSENDDATTGRFRRLPTGKKGLGKLALFGLARTIQINTCHEGKESQFELDWNDLLSSENVYQPKTIFVDHVSEKPNGTTITLLNLKRKTPFDLESIANSLSKIFIVNDDFNILLKSPNGEVLIVNNSRRYTLLEKQFEWDDGNFVPKGSEYEGKISGELYTGETPIKPSSGLRGITLFSRGKLVNLPEYFSSSTSSHFFQYLTGWLSVDFIDLLDEDVISTNRQSINWEHPEMEKLRSFLAGVVSQVNSEWRSKRKALKDEELKNTTGIDTEKWFSTLPDDIKDHTSQIVETLGGEDALEKFTPVIKALHEIVPEYPSLHWRHLHPEIQAASETGYISANYYNAFLEAAKRYANRVRDYSGNTNEHDLNLMGQVFGPEDEKVLKVALGYLRENGTHFASNTRQNIEGAQRKLSQGVIEGGRNIVAHEEQLDLAHSELFSEKDCLDLLSLISHLMCRIEHAKNHADATTETGSV